MAICGNLWLLTAICFAFLAVSESRIRYKYRTRNECRDKGPRRSEELPDVVLTGFVEQVYPSVDGGQIYSGSVFVKWVFKGSKRLMDNRITIGGFGTSSLCYTNVTKRDTWIFMLNEVSDGFLTLNTTLQKVNLQNLDRVKALTRDEPYRRRQEIVELPCETQYCQNNGNCVEEDSSASGILTMARCLCIQQCAHGYDPVCGSNGETFVNDCGLRSNSCQRGHNYFTRYPGTCEGGRRTRSVQMAYISPVTT